MTAPAPLVWLFDVDGTLLRTDGAAKQAFVLAVRDHLGVDDPLQDIGFAGRTEPLILADILEKHGRTFVDGETDRFWASVLDHMRAVFHPGRGRVLPGVVELLDAIEREPSWVSTLLTGNMTGMTRIKLEAFGLLDRFAFGSFGEEAADRNEIARLAVRRASRSYGVSAASCIVVGDTELDIDCARAAGARVIAVGTGSRRRAELEAHGPDLALDDLTDLAGILKWARSGSPA